MAINLYSGTPGSGKSLHMAKVIQDKLNYGYSVIGTMKINESCLRKKHADYYYINIYDLNPKDLVKFSKEYFSTHKYKNIEGKLLLIIDESQRIFNPRAWNVAGRNDWITFFAEHRHFGFDVILVAQMDIMLDKQIRGLIEYEYIHRKVSNFGIMGKLISLFSMGKLFVTVKMWYPMKEKVGSEFFKGKKKLYTFYDTFEIFEVSGNES